MKVVANNCPNCQAPIDERSRFCSYCGTQIEVADEAVHMKYTYQKVDDARIKEADVREKIRLKELEIEALKLQSEIQQKKFLSWIRLALIIVFFALEVLLLILYLTEWDEEYFFLALALLIIAAIIIPKMLKNK